MARRRSSRRCANRGDDILGDGVNIAARLEGIADPNRICISEDAFRQVRGKVEAEFADLGEQSLKNIARPLRIYRVGSSSATRQAVSPAGALLLPDKPSIRVLPFANMSGDPEQEYFADGIVEDIITLLSRYPLLFVIARNSSFTYKGRSVDVKQVGRELGVRYALEGSVRKAGNRVRITAQLVEAEAGNHVWAERYDRDLADIFGLQDEITEAVTIAIAPAIADAERQRAMRKPPGSLDAWAASGAFGISAKVHQTTTRWQRASFNKPLISTRTSPAVTRGSPMPKRAPPACTGRELWPKFGTRHSR